jgi:hypothetical protein
MHFIKLWIDGADSLGETRPNIYSIRRSDVNQIVEPQYRDAPTIYQMQKILCAGIICTLKCLSAFCEAEGRIQGPEAFVDPGAGPNA